MYKVTLVLLAFFSLVLPILAVPVPVPDQVDGLEKLATTATFSGKGTYFEPGLGACGKTSKSSDFIVALSTKMYGNGSNCGKNVQIVDADNHISIRAQIVDKCPGCGINDLDLSPAAFRKLAPLSQGVIKKINWSFA